MTNPDAPDGSGGGGQAARAFDSSSMRLAGRRAPSAEPGVRIGREVVVVALILLLALALRVLFVYQVHTSPVPDLDALRPGTDIEKHDYIARWVLEYGWFEKSADVSPLYPYVFLPLVYWLTSGSVFWAKIVQECIGAGTVLLIYLLARRLYGNRAAVYAGLVAAVYSPFIVYDGQLLGEVLLTFLAAAFVLVMLGVEGRMSLRRAAVAGAILALAVASKPTAAVLVAPAAVWMWARTGRGLKGAKAIVAPLAVMAAVALVVLAPFGWRNYKATGQLTLVRGNGGLMLYMGNNAAASGAYGYPATEEGRRLERETHGMPLGEKDRVYRNAAFSFMWRHPGREAALLARKTYLFFCGVEVPNNISFELYRQTTFLEFWVFCTFAFVFPVAAAGFVFSLRRRGVWFVAVSVLVYAASIVAFLVVGRYRLAVVPLVIPAAGFALYEAVLAFRTLDMRRLGLIALVALAVGVPLNLFAVRTFFRQRLHPDGFVARHGSDVMHYDDSDYPTPYSGLLVAPETIVRKDVIVRESREGLEAATVLVYARVFSAGTLSVTLNGHERFQQVLAAPGGKWIEIPFAASDADPGSNAVTLHSDGQLQARIMADNVYNFGRSMYSPDGIERLTGDLDQITYRTNPALHIGGHEFKIRLLLHFAGPGAMDAAAAPAR